MGLMMIKEGLSQEVKSVSVLVRRWSEAAVADSRQCTDVLQQQIPDQLTAEYVMSKDCWVNI